jgi:hypothetical protein
MVARRISLSLALVASAALAVPAAQAAPKQPAPVAHSAGGDAPPLNPPVVGIPIARTDKALSSAADFIDQGNGALAAKPLTATRRYLIRSYNGARYLIAHPPAAPADDAKASAAKFRAMARRAVRSSRRAAKNPNARSRWVRAQASQDDVVAPVIADNPTAVFNVLTSQYSAATAAVGMYPDTTGALQKKVNVVLNTAVILRNRLVKAVAAAEPPAPADDAAVHAHSSQDEEGVATYAPVMPGLIVLLDAEIQQLQAAVPTAPAAAKDDLNKAIAADQKIETLVNTLWPPAAD